MSFKSTSSDVHTDIATLTFGYELWTWIIILGILFCVLGYSCFYCLKRHCDVEDLPVHTDVEAGEVSKRWYPHVLATYIVMTLWCPCLSSMNK